MSICYNGHQYFSVCGECKQYRENIRKPKVSMAELANVIKMIEVKRAILYRMWSQTLKEVDFPYYLIQNREINDLYVKAEALIYET